ncbi:hypothetical protein AB0O20_27615 [Streptomyces kronopolitis]|uniref:hypothetical protein n=1 Tax=Streptomyces kronopolitis TaxID=1612435 RepID=UPI0034453148
MSSLQEHVDSNRDPQKAARAALFNAITEQVAAVQKSATPTAAATALKELAEAYSAVYHGAKG